MSQERRKRYESCYIAAKRGTLVLRWRQTVGGRPTLRAFATKLPDTARNRECLAPLVATVGAVVRAGNDPMAVLREFFARRIPVPKQPTGPTLVEYINSMFLPYHQSPQVRKAQARDYRRHLAIVNRIIGGVHISALEPTHIRTVQTVLLGEGKSTKYVKNILSGARSAQ